jgi:hypothetical protein
MNRSFRIPFAHGLQVALASLVACALSAAPAAAWTSNPALNTPICTAADNQSSPVTVPDGQGGVFIAWNDNRAGNTDLYIQHLDVKGNALWGANGVVLCDAPDGQSNLQLLADGAGGVFAAWTDLRSGSGTRDIWAQHLNAAGVEQWLHNGRVVCDSPNHQLNVHIARGAPQFNELLLVWEDWRGVDTDIYVQGVNGTTGAIRYAINGLVVCNAAGDQKRPSVVADGAGGVIVGWQDFRSGTTLDAYAQRFVLGANAWTANGVGLCTLTGNQQNLVGTSDGSGGAIYAWDDDRAGVGNHDVYGNRVDIAGTRLWGTHGLVIDNSATTVLSLDIAPDGSHGAYVVWADMDIRAQRMLANGSPLIIGGIAICMAASTQSSPQIATDGNGGAFITWYDQRSGEADIYANRLLASGLPWGSDGIPIGTATLHQFFPTLAADGRGAAIVAWGDGRLGNLSSAFDIYAQRIDRFAALGEPEPAIMSLTDVPGDEGGSLALDWSASPLVTPGNVASYSYRLWRATPVAGGALTTGDARMARATTSEPDEAARAGGPVFAPEFSASSTAWEWVATIPADLSPSYSQAVPTAYDSVPGLNPPPTQYMVELRGGPTGGSRFSLPDSARSVDNLPPAAPAPFTGEYAAGEARLHWDPNAEPDFKVYILHRGDAPGFTPTPLTYLATLTDTGYVDVTGEAHVYQLIAVDVHGNASPASEVVPGGTVDVPGSGVTLAFLGHLAPNPSRGDVALRFGLARAGGASVDVFDAAGRRVRELARGEFAAGEHLVHWDGRDAEGGVSPAGIYFVRMQTAGFRAERRFVRMR